MLKDWDDYYPARLNGQQKSDVRDGCHPLIFRSGSANSNAIVLVHGLTDSPHFMRDIGEYFCTEMGFDVYIPLLRAHGLKDPQDMRNASAIEWKKDVQFAIAAAKTSGGKVSIGGLSTGGTLSVEMALTDGSIDGGVFLFSAALGLATQTGNLSEILLRTPLANILDLLDSADLIDDSPSGNPFRYTKMDIGGAEELSTLIAELDILTADRSVLQPLFAVHSEADTTADIDRVASLVKTAPHAQMFRIGKNFNVPHASTVLKNPVRSINNSPLEPHNPFFADMMKSLHSFAIERHLIEIA
jgi:esterase/lipase